MAERVDRDFRTGVRAGVVTTPTVFVDGEAHRGVPGPELLDRLRRLGGLLDDCQFAQLVG